MAAPVPGKKKPSLVATAAYVPASVDGSFPAALDPTAATLPDNGAGTVENCDLTGNVRGTFNIDVSSQVRKSGNSE